MMKLALKNIERVKIYKRYGIIYRILVFMKDKTVRGGYVSSLNEIGDGRETIKKYINRAKMTSLYNNGYLIITFEI